MRGRLSAAQRALNDYIREGRLSANRSEPIGSGAYGVVYNSDVPGNVIKQSTQWGQDLEKEANLQAIAADIGIAPQVRGLETFRGGVGDRIEMQDVRKNYESLPTDPIVPVRDVSEYAEPGTRKDLQNFAIRHAQQLGHLALKGVRLEDRHEHNVLRHKMTGRPLQIDFGIADRMSPDQQAAQLANVTAEGFEAAGIGEMGSILRATVMDYLEGGQVTEAMDVAKQGFSRLQKIKRIDNIKTDYKRAVEQQEIEKAVDKLEEIVAKEDDTMARILGY